MSNHIDVEAGGFADGIGEKNVSSLAEENNMVIIMFMYTVIIILFEHIGSSYFFLHNFQASQKPSDDCVEEENTGAKESDDAISVTDDMNEELESVSDNEKEKGIDSSEGVKFNFFAGHSHKYYNYFVNR